MFETYQEYFTGVFFRESSIILQRNKELDERRQRLMNFRSFFAPNFRTCAMRFSSSRQCRMMIEVSLIVEGEGAQCS